MTPNDPRLLLAAINLLQQAVAANSAAVLANTEEQHDANQSPYSKVVGGAYRTRLDDLMGKHVGAGDKRAFDYDADGNLGSTTSGSGGVGRDPKKGVKTPGE